MSIRPVLQCYISNGFALSNAPVWST